MQLVLPFPARYRVELLDSLSEAVGVSSRRFAFPGSVPLGPQREFVAGPLFGVWPEGGEPWVGAVEEEGCSTGWLVGWPDGRSLCIVWAMWGYLVRCDDPTLTSELDWYPITDVVAVEEHSLVVFADHVSLIAYGPEGIVWRTPRLVFDDLKILGVEGDLLRASGWAGGDSDQELTVSLTSGESSFSHHWRLTPRTVVLRVVLN